MKRIAWSMYVLGMYVALSVMAMGQVTFERHYGGERYDAGMDVLEKPGGGFLLIGTTRSVSDDTTDAWVVGTDAQGNLLWTDVYGGSRFDSGISLLPASDGGYILALATNSFSDSYDIHLVKIDTTGVVDWENTYGGSGSDYTHDMASTSDGGYVVIAHTTSFGEGGLDFYLLKVSHDGDSLWSRTYGGAEWDWGGSVQQTTDGGYILAGDTKSFGDARADMYVVKTDAVGDTLWTRTYGKPDKPDRVNCILQTSDGGYLLGCESIGGPSAVGAETLNALVIKTDAFGEEQWSTVLHESNTSTLADAVELDNGDFMVVGDALRGDEQGFDAYAVRLTGDGTLVGEWFYGGSEYDRFDAVQRTADGGFVFVGMTESLAPDMDTQVYLVKTDADGNVTGAYDDIGDARPRNVRLENNYPNPFNPSTSMRFELPNAMHVSLTVHDVYGRMVRLPLHDERREAGTHRIVFDATGLLPGVYFYSLIADGLRLTRKMVVRR